MNIYYRSWAYESACNPSGLSWARSYIFCKLQVRRKLCWPCLGPATGWVLATLGQPQLGRPGSPPCSLSSSRMTAQAGSHKCGGDSESKQKCIYYLSRSNLGTGMLSFLLHSTGQHKSPVQPQLKGWRNGFQLFMGSAAKSHYKGWIIKEGWRVGAIFETNLPQLE